MKYLFAVLCFLWAAGGVYAEEKLVELRSEHFIIKYHPQVSEYYARDIKDMSEKFYRVITEEFDFVRDKYWLWENRANIFIAKDREDYTSRFQCPAWSGACVNYAEKIIYTYPDQERFVSFLVHELTHIIFREYVRNNSVPLWLDEAVAAYIEEVYGKNNVYKPRLSMLEGIIKKGGYIPFAQLDAITAQSLNSQTEEYVQMFYLQAYSMVNFLIKKYQRDRFSFFLYSLRQGLSCEEALSRGFSSIRRINDFEEQWKTFYLK